MIQFSPNGGYIYGLDSGEDGYADELSETFLRLDVEVNRSFAQNRATTTGLTFGYYGGLIPNGSSGWTTINNGTVALTNNATNYVEMTTAGAVSANTSGFTAGRIPLYTVVTSAGAITTVTPRRPAFVWAVAGW